MKAAQQAFYAIYQEGYQYKRAGIVLAEITGDEAVEQDLFADAAAGMRQRKLMEATDKINMRYGMDKVKLAAQVYEKEKHTPANQVRFEPFRNQTTDIDDVIVVK